MHEFHLEGVFPPEPRSRLVRYPSWNSRMYPVWKDGDPRHKDSWKGGSTDITDVLEEEICCMSAFPVSLPQAEEWFSMWRMIRRLWREPKSPSPSAWSSPAPRSCFPAETWFGLRMASSTVKHTLSQSGTNSSLHHHHIYPLSWSSHISFVSLSDLLVWEFEPPLCRQEPSMEHWSQCTQLRTQTGSQFSPMEAQLGRTRHQTTCLCGRPGVSGGNLRLRDPSSLQVHRAD